MSTMVGSGASCGGCGLGHAMAGGEKLSAAVVTAATEGNRARGERGSAEELTAPVERAASVRERARGGGEMEEELT